MTTASILLAATLLQPVAEFGPADVGVLLTMQEREPISMVLVGSYIVGPINIDDHTSRKDLPTPYCELDEDGYPKFTDWRPMKLDLDRLRKFTRSEESAPWEWVSPSEHDPWPYDPVLDRIAPRPDGY